MQIRALESLNNEELIQLIKQEREQYEAVGAGGVSHLVKPNLTWQQRVINEEKELSEKIDKLVIFIDSFGFAKLDVDEQYMLKRQLNAMLLYSEALSDRISVFNDQ